MKARSLKRRPGRWVAVLTTGYIIRDGKRRRVRKKFGGQPEVARTKASFTADAARTSTGAAIFRRACKRSAVSSISGFRKSHSKACAPKPSELHSDMVKLHIKPALGSVQIERLTPDIVQTFLNDKLGSALCPHCKASISSERMPDHINEKHAGAKKRAFRALGAKSVFTSALLFEARSRLS